MLRILGQPRISYAASRYLHASSSRHGYIVLVPEIGEDQNAIDGIVKANGLPAFNEITIENCLGAIGTQAVAVEKTVKRIETQIQKQQQQPNASSLDIEGIFRDIDEAIGPLDTTWGIAKALYLGNSTLIPTKSYMNIHERARIARAAKHNSKIIFDALATKQQQQTERDNVEDNDNAARLVEKYLLEGKLNGLLLPSRNGLKEAVTQLGKERASFKNKVNMSVHTFHQTITDYQLVREFPRNLIEGIAKDPNQPQQGPWKITLQPQIVDGFLKYCPDRLQRWNVWQANIRKCSGQLEKSLENSTHLEKIRSLRKTQANILGYPNYATMSMQTKMVQSIENLKEIFTKLLQFAGPAQSVEITELQEFATVCGFQHKLEFCDIAYWQRKHLHSKYQLNEETLREYFPLPRVFANLFTLSEELFNIKIEERKDAQVWQPAVKYFDIFDLDSESGANTPIGGFYIDCFSKENRYGKTNGWMVSIRNRNYTLGHTPLCAFIFNFTEPVYGKPYLLDFDSLQMVFKTFGTGLQHILTKAKYTDLAGLSNIEWDASQVAGNVLSNFLNNTNILKSISGHYASDEQLSDELAQNVQHLKINLAGHHLCQELYLADLDIELHTSTSYWLDVVKKLWPVYQCMPLDKRYSHPCSMTEIFSGDWGAAYFSHLYSRIIAADISDSFEEHPKEDYGKVGKRFKETFLSSGGSIPTAEVFRRFRGRDPSVQPLLKSLNILKPSQTTGEL